MPSPQYFVTTKNKVVTPIELMQALKAKSPTGEHSQQIEDEFAEAYDNDHRIKQPRYAPGFFLELLKINTWHATACRVIAQDTAGSSWDLNATTDEPDEVEKRRVERFFNNLPTPITSTLYEMEHDLNAIGWGALELVRDNERKLVNIKHIPAHTVRVVQKGELYIQIRGTKKVYFKDFDSLIEEYDPKTGNAKQRTKGGKIEGRVANEILFFRRYAAESEHYGLPAIMPALGAILSDIHRQEYNSSFFKNNGIPAYAVTISGDYDPGEVDPSTNRTPLENMIEEHLTGAGEVKDGSVLIFTVPSRQRQDGAQSRVEVKFHKLADEIKEASFTKFREDNRDEVFGAHSLPLYRAGVAAQGALGQNVAAETDEIYKRNVVDPAQNRDEHQINRVLAHYLRIRDYEWELSEIDTKDAEADISIAVQLFGMGMMTPNEGIRHFGKKFKLTTSTAEGMDHHFIGGKSVESGLAIMERTNPPGSQPGSLPADDPKQDPAQSETIRSGLDGDSKIPRESRDVLQGQVDSQR